MPGNWLIIKSLNVMVANGIPSRQLVITKLGFSKVDGNEGLS